MDTMFYDFQIEYRKNGKVYAKTCSRLDKFLKKIVTVLCTEVLNDNDFKFAVEYIFKVIQVLWWCGVPYDVVLKRMIPMIANKLTRTCSLDLDVVLALKYILGCNFFPKDFFLYTVCHN